MANEDHYTVLEVLRTATDAEVRTAYRRLARENHPDANPAPEAEARMRRINEAWEVLRDPQKRSLYDRQLPRGRVAVRTVRRQPPPRPAARERPQPAPWPGAEDAPRAAPSASAEFTGDASINWYKEIGVREDAPRAEILKALSRMAASLNGAPISATEFTRRRTVMREAWAVLGDQYVRASYDRARKNSGPEGRSGSEPDAANDHANPKSEIRNPKSTPPPGYRLGPVTVNGFVIDKGVALEGADLRGADLRGLDLAGIDLRSAKLQGVDFEAASLRKARLANADLAGANFRFADLSNADLTAANLRQADLAHAALHATKFFRATLAGASLAEAVGPGVNLDYADLARADLTGAKITAQLIERATLSGTIMPDGTVSGG